MNRIYLKVPQQLSRAMKRYLQVQDKYLIAKKKMDTERKKLHLLSLKVLKAAQKEWNKKHPIPKDVTFWEVYPIAVLRDTNNVLLPALFIRYDVYTPWGKFGFPSPEEAHEYVSENVNATPTRKRK